MIMNYLAAYISMLHFSSKIAKMSVNDSPELYVFNAFFMTMRSKFVGKDNAVCEFAYSFFNNVHRLPYSLLASLDLLV